MCSFKKLKLNLLKLQIVLLNEFFTLMQFCLMYKQSIDRFIGVFC
jgi:hypothetical protein